MNTNWSSPKTNLLAAMNSLRDALAAGHKARLIKLRNEDCAYPIRKALDRDITNPENWKTNGATMKSKNSIESGDYSEGEKYMMTTYTQLFGSPEAILEYSRTGIVTGQNDFGVGTAHLVKREAMIKYLIAKGDNERAKCFELNGDNTHFVEDYHLKPEYSRKAKQFKHKLWVVELLDNDTKEKINVPIMVHLLNIVLYPIKFIPERNVLRMEEYKCVTYRIGGVTNGFAIEFHVPKKFSFK